MCRVPEQLKELVKQRLEAAADEIFELLEKTISEYEEHLVSKYEQQRLQGSLFSPDGGFPVEAADDSSDLPCIKEEQGIDRTELCRNSPPVSEDDVSVKTEDRWTWTPPAHHTQTVPLPPPGGALLQHTQTVPLPPPGGALLQHTKTAEDALTQDTWREEHLDLSHTLDCAFPLSPPRGAALHPGSAGKVRKRRGGGASGLSQKRPHECPLCGLRFQSHFNLETHLRVHTGERPFSCPVCEKTFNRKDSMANHMKIHRGETFCCSECGKRYSDKSNLRRHTLSMHAGKGHLGHRPAAESHHMSHDPQRKDIT